MKYFKTFLFSTFEAGFIYFVMCGLLVRYVQLSVPFFFGLACIFGFFVWFYTRRQNFWLSKFENQWCPQNRWFYSESKNSSIYWQWVGTIREAERVCKERVAIEKLEVS